MKRNRLLLFICLVVAFLGISATSSQAVTLWAAGDNDGNIHHSSYGSSWWYGGWNTGNPTLSVYSAFYPGSPSSWERDYAFVEIPIASLHTGTVTSATLQLYSLGFGLGDYWYGSTNVYHQNPGAYSPTGNVAVDNPNYWGSDWGWNLFNTDIPGSGAPGWKAFNVTDAVAADLAAGRNFSTFLIQASREVYGGLYASEQTGFGPNMNVQGVNLVPIPGSVLLLGTGLLSLAVVGWRKKRS